MKRVVVFLVITILTLTGSFTIAKAEENNQITVGYYDYEPYFYIDKQGQVTGIYHEIIQQLAQDLDLEVNYVMEGFSDIIERSKNNEVDLMLGLHFTEERNESIIYSDLSIGTEELAVYMHEPTMYGDLEQLDGKRFALVTDEQNSKWIASFLKSKGIEPEYIYVKSYGEANQMFALGQVDATIGTIYTDAFEISQQIYRYTAGSVYIGVSPRNTALMYQINSKLQHYASLDNNPIDLIYQKYLPDQQSSKFMIGLAYGFVICFVCIPMIVFYPKIKYKFVRNQIRQQIGSNRFVPFYQPIVNPHTNEIKGIEALIRFKHPKKGIIGPYAFIDKIEQHEMLDELTLWLLQTIIKDYQRIKKFNHFKNQEAPYYISLNLSSREIEDVDMVEKMIRILKESSIPKDSICLEIIERFGISNMEQIQKGVATLKANGFKIAIDDFGVDYSNLKLLEVLDFDILKLDKYFADEMENSKIVKHTIGFLGQLTQKFDKSLVMEGIEEEAQKEFLKSYQYPQMFIQGYYYSKPIPIEELEFLKV